MDRDSASSFSFVAMEKVPVDSKLGVGDVEAVGHNHGTGQSDCMGAADEASWSLSDSASVSVRQEGRDIGRLRI